MKTLFRHARPAAGPARLCGAALLFAAVLIAFAGTETAGRFSATLARPTAPARAIGSAKLRGALVGAGILALQAPPPHPAPAAAGECPDLELGLQPPSAGTLPSSAVAPAPWRERAPPLVSVSLDPCRLARLHADPWQHGRASEQAGWVSVFERGRLRFATAVGVRLHGGSSRKAPPYSYRLYFRDAYGSAGLPPDLLAEDLRAPLARVVLAETTDRDRDGRPWYFPGEVAYEIGRRLGGWAPRTRPVWFSLNGEPPRVYVLGEHIGSDYLARHFGHGDFDLLRRKREAEDPDRAALLAEAERIRRAPRPFTMARAAEGYDVERLTTWIVSVLFCATGDLYQDAMIRDRSGRLARGRWTWIHWDHDMSFRAPPGISRFGRQKEVLPHVLWSRRPQDVAPSRALVQRLIEEDSRYRGYLAQRVVRALNHELTPDFLAALVARYEGLARELGVEDLHFVERLRDFFEFRPERVYRQLETVLGMGAPAVVEVSGPEGSLRIDGFPAPAHYRGRYPIGMTIAIAVEPDSRPRLEGWRIDGARLAGASPRLELPVTGPLQIEALFGRPLPDAERSPEARPTPRPR